MRKFPTKICVRKYSGEYRIFHFKGFDHIQADKNSTNLAKNISSNPKDIKPTSKHVQKVIDATQKLAPTLSSKKECTEEKTEKKKPIAQCLRPVPRMRPVESCNVKNEIPTLKLSNGCVMPMIGLGTWGSECKKVTKAVARAIKVGYRMIDCAHAYQNENAVGAAINEAFKKCRVKRDDLFITSKLWNTFHRPDLVIDACCQSLNDLKLSYLNLYLIHWPMGYKEGGDLIPFDACGRVLTSRVDYIETWKAMEDLVHKGYTHSIGLSNFNKQQIERIWKVAKIKPVVNQIECHPYLNQSKLMTYLKSKNIALIAYSPLGSPSRPWAKDDGPNLLDDEVIEIIASQHDRTEAQICIRYQIQRGNIVIAKSVTPSRIDSNFEVMDFDLTKDDMKMLDELDCKLRFVALPKLSNHPYYPFHDEY